MESVDKTNSERLAHSFIVCLLLFTLISPQLVTCEAMLEAAESRQRGIVVPKRSSIIIGLNQQFNRRHFQATSSRPPLGASDSSVPPNTNETLGNEIETSSSTSVPTSAQVFGVHLPLPKSWLSSRRNKPQKQHQQQDQNQLQSLYLDRHQQQLLAAYPNLLDAANLTSSSNFNLSSFLQTRSDLLSSNNPNSHGEHQLALNGTLNGVLLSRELMQQLPQQQLQQQQQQTGQQLYRGYSLIELEVRSEQDRRYIRSLYGNLSQAINEQAQNVGSPSSLAVSPYVDVDFWSFRYAINDRLDIMVSPKARAFILGQLARAKIKHRIKIDDIQTRLDQQPSGSYTAPQLSASNNSNLPKTIENQQQQLTGRLSASGRDASGGPETALGGSPTSSATQAAAATPERLNGRQAQEVPAKALNESQFFENYQRLSEINQFLENLVERNRDVAQVKVIGRSSQGRYLRVLKLGYDQQDVEGHTSAAMAASAAAADLQEPSRPHLSNASSILQGFFKRQELTRKLGSIWLDGGTHAREWISPATVLYLAHRLADNHRKCLNFFDQMRLIVGQQETLLYELLQLQSQQQSQSSQQQQRAARQLLASNFPSATPNLEPDLLSGINEINSNLLGRPAAEILSASRQRGEFERMMEMLAKDPQTIAQQQGCNLDLDQLLRRYTFYIMPVLNPDGYEYSHTHNRLWRKTRSTSNHPIYRHFCLGADPNRNYDARHGSAGSSSHPCSQTYAGTVPFTEPETRHQSNFVYANRLNMKMFISFHSYSQMILLPFSHSRQLAPDHKDLESVGQAAVKAIERTHGTVYKVGPSASILYTASGTASDWAYEKAGIKYSYTIELRDTGTFGFLLPRTQIVPTGEETYNGLLAMIEQMEKNDNLLTSKSVLRAGGTSVVVVAGHQLSTATSPASSSSSSSSAGDLNHVPDSERLKSISEQQAPRAPLENIIDGSLTWAAPERGPWGVRDRRPQSSVAQHHHQEPPARQVTPLHADAALSSHSPSELGADIKASVASDSELGNELSPQAPPTHDMEPDSGYAFEGEGELLEPTGEAAAAAEVGALRASRHSHFRRQPTSSLNSIHLTSSGRNAINSPGPARRHTTPVPRRESSERDGA